MLLICLISKFVQKNYITKKLYINKHHVKETHCFNRWQDQPLLAMQPEERVKKRAMESVVRSLRSST